MLRIALFLLLLLVLTSCEPVAEDNPEQLDTSPVGDKDKPDTALVGDNPFIAIVGGSFKMGQTDVTLADPVHQVTVSAFRLQKYEVTAGQYKACVDAAVCVYNGQTSGTYYT